MYPKVKVRSLDEDDDYDFSKHTVRAFNSLHISDSTPVKQVKHSSPVSVAKVPKSYIPRPITSPPLPQSVKKSELEADVKKTRIRASSIPRPRAVISSPDNDQILGSKNKTRLQRTSATKNHNFIKSRQSEATCTRTSTTSKNHFKTIEDKVTNGGTYTRKSNTHMKLSDNGGCEVTSDVKVQKGSGIDVRVPTTKISKGKPCFMIT